MGDRANIVILQDDQAPTSKIAVFLYSHWGGEEMPDILADALDYGQERWNDPSYLARIIFQKMVKTDRGMTGFGISVHLTDNEHPLLVVNTQKQTVTEYPEDEYHECGFAKLDEYEGIPFTDYSGEWMETEEKEEED